jgi:phasin family protein
MANKPVNADGESSNLNPFGDLTRVFEQFKVPGVDVSSIIEARRKDVEALVAANEAAFEGLKALARTQTDLLVQTLNAAQAAAKGKAEGGTGLPDPAKFAEGAQKAWQKMLEDVKALAELARKSQADALACLGTRVTESVRVFQHATHAK